MIRPVSYATILDDHNWPRLMAEYSAECASAELGDPNPQRDLYELMENSGRFQAFGVYDGDELIGFASVLMYVLPHFGKKIAATESIFITSRKRSGEGVRLLEHVKQYAIEKGCFALLYSAPVDSRFDGLLEMKRIRHSNNVYIEPL